MVYWHWGVAGAAWASLVAEYAGLLMGLWAVRQSMHKAPSRVCNKTLWSASAFTQLLSLNKNIFIRTLALELVFYLQTAIAANLGVNVLAANAVLMNFVMIMAFGLDGFAHATEALSGKAVGEKNRYNFIGSVIVTGIWSFLCSAIFVIVFAIFGHTMIELMTSIPPVVETARQYLWYLIFIPLIAIWSYWLDGIFIGVTKVKEMRNSMLAAVFLGFIPASTLVYWIGNHGLWIAFYLFMIMRAIGLGFYFYKLDKQRAFC